MEKNEIDLTNKVVLEVDSYIELKEKIKDLENEVKVEKNKYSSLLNYLFSECEVKKYLSGEYYLDYDSYNNHLVDYLKEISPEIYERKIQDYKKDCDINE